MELSHTGMGDLFQQGAQNLGIVAYGDIAQVIGLAMKMIQEQPSEAQALRRRQLNMDVVGVQILEVMGYGVVSL